MNQLTELIVSSAFGILTILAGLTVQTFKQYLLAKGGEKALAITEILAKTAVNATEQVAKELDIRGQAKLDYAKRAVIRGLKQYNIEMTQSQIENFIEAAVKEANKAWKE